MLKLLLLFYLNLLLLIITQYEAKSFKRGHLTDNTIEDKSSWQGLWFPHPSNYQNNNDDINPELVNVAESEEFEIVSKRPHTNYKGEGESWQGLWFPNPPGYENNNLKTKKISGDFKTYEAESKTHECDNGKDNLEADYDPKDKRHSYNYLCLGNRTQYAPNLNTTALLFEHLIPAAYEPPVKCLNETIEYSESLPTFGSYRPLAPKFGTYQYLPPQRWLHSLADGALVLLYHPCAFSGQIVQLQNTLKGCLYRHIITPSQMLTPERPLALLAWGKCLQMSVVDDGVVVKFIKDNAKLGFRHKQQKLKLSSKLYEAGLMTEAHLVTDEQDTEICGYKEN